MRVVHALLLFASACGFQITGGATTSDDAGGGGSDAVAGDGSFGCYGTGLVVVCPLTAPVPTYEVTNAVRFDTGVGGNCTAVTGTNVTGTCVVVAETIRISGDVRAVGTQPLILVATETLEISSRLDAASRDDGTGAGAATTVCSGGSGPGGDLDGAGGGAGGSFTGVGGAGGNNAGGAAGPALMPTTVHGGCKGQRGADGIGSGGAGGAGGGVVYLIAGTSISLGGSINVSGQGGKGGNFGALAGGGGGGGGAGGMIVLDAPAVRIDGSAFALGGGGGGGGDGFSDGGDGASPEAPMPAATGGGGGGGGGDGGAGGASARDGGAGGQSSSAGGGGGGGGAAGSITVLGARTGGGALSPQPM